MSPTSGHRVVALVLDQVGLLDLAAPTHLFGYCGPPLYRFEMATCQPGRVRTSAGPDLHVEHGLGVLLTADTVIVPGYEDESAVIPPAALSARVMSICTGAFALAGAGLLDGKTATTHWAAAALLGSKYPKVTCRLTSCTSTRVRSSPAQGSRPTWTCACTPSAATTAPRVSPDERSPRRAAPRRRTGPNSSNCPSQVRWTSGQQNTATATGPGTHPIAVKPFIAQLAAHNVTPEPFCDGSRFETGLVDLDGTPGLFAQVNGRNSAAMIAWLEEQDPEWRTATSHRRTRRPRSAVCAIDAMGPGSTPRPPPAERVNVPGH